MTDVCSQLTRRALLANAAATAAFGVVPARAQTPTASNWPDRTVRMIVPYPAGGSTDVLFRLLADKLKERFGQSFVIENRPGASGNVGIEVVAKSAADGYTIGCATVGHFAINQFLFSRMPYDAERDLVASALTYVLPIGTPRPIVDRLSAAQREFAGDATLQSRFLAAGGRILSSTPEAASAFAAKERKMWQEIVRLSGLKPE